MVRHIQVDSEADAAYDTASQAQKVHGWGYIRALTEFESRSFNQKIRIARVKDAFKVYPDPYCRELDFSDARYWFECEDIPVHEYRTLYPKSAVATMSDFASTGDSNWFPTQCVRVCEYFWVENEEFEICQWADGTVHRVDESPDDQVADAIQTRMETVRIVNWVKMNAVEALDGYRPGAKSKWYTTDGFKIIPGPYIPIVPVLGDEYIVDGRTQYSGMVRFARDAQRQYNYMRTAAVEMIALAPKAPFIMAEGQDENHETEWKQANVRNLSRLLYKPVALGNQLAPPPQRQAVEPPIEAITVAINQAEHDLMSTMGLYQPSLGAVGPEQSGKAILARQQKGDVANFNYSDNFARALRHLGRIILGWIPVYYDVPRMAGIVWPNGDHAAVPVNRPYTKDLQGNIKPLAIGETAPNGLAVKMHDLINFRGTVTISTGPSYQTKKMEEANSVLSLVQSFPQIMSIAGDLLVGSFDWHGAREIAQRLKMALPPAIQASIQAENLSPGNVAQMMQRAEALQQELQVLQTKLATKAPELASKERVALINALAGIQEERIKKGADDGANTAAELDAATQLSHEAATNAANAAQEERLRQMQLHHDAVQNELQRRHELSTQGLKQNHEAGMAQQQQQAEAQLAQQQPSEVPGS